MSLTANTGLVVSRGIAFLMLGVMLVHCTLNEWRFRVSRGNTYEAYAPRPTVLDMMRNGSSFGKGSS
jgi:hypothetical protein